MLVVHTHEQVFMSTNSLDYLKLNFSIYCNSPNSLGDSVNGIIQISLMSIPASESRKTHLHIRHSVAHENELHKLGVSMAMTQTPSFCFLLLHLFEFFLNCFSSNLTQSGCELLFVWYSPIPIFGHSLIFKVFVTEYSILGQGTQ